MKRLKYVMLILMSLLATLSFSACEEPTELFSEQALKMYSIEWMSPPEGAVDEVQYREDNSAYLQYEAKMAREEDFNAYLNNVFENFKNGDYTIANYYAQFSSGHLDTFKIWFHIAYDETKTYYVNDHVNTIVYRLYYTVTPLGKRNEEVGGREVKNVAYLDFVWGKIADEDGLHQIKIYLNKLTGHGYVVNYYLDSVPSLG